LPRKSGGCGKAITATRLATLLYLEGEPAEATMLAATMT
jgi:hypothetical protein